MASQKYWQEETLDEASHSIDHSSSAEDLLTQEEAEAIFRFECKQWIKNNQEALLKSPFKTAYNKPWTKKSSSKDFVTPMNTEKKKKEM